MYNIVGNMHMINIYIHIHIRCSSNLSKVQLSFTNLLSPFGGKFVSGTRVTFYHFSVYEISIGSG